MPWLLQRLPSETILMSFTHTTGSHILQELLLAGIAAKRISGKPLVIHVHATEFDRSGTNVNSVVFDLEKLGMKEADKIIAVSNLTRNIIINKYGINPNTGLTPKKLLLFIMLSIFRDLNRWISKGE